MDKVFHGFGDHDQVKADIIRFLNSGSQAPDILCSIA